MIATIQIGNSDDKLTQKEWSDFVSEVDAVFKTDVLAIDCYFFATSEGAKPWQNACWVVSIKETDVDLLIKRLVKVRKMYRQDSVAIVLGDVRMI